MINHCNVAMKRKRMDARFKKATRAFENASNHKRIMGSVPNITDNSSSTTIPTIAEIVVTLLLLSSVLPQ